MKHILLLAGLLCTSIAHAKPNVIYILADDLGYGDLSCYGQEKFQTPNIDRLATEGLKFTNHYSGNTVCSPSRAVLMTGVHSGKCYIRGNVPKEIGAALPEDFTVLPEVFKNAGYRTGAFGKWGLGITNGAKNELPSTHGFDEFVGWKSQLIAHTYYPSSYVKNGQEIPLKKGTYVNPIIMQEALDFIASSAEAQQPFFCYIPSAIPHAAMHAPKELHEKWRKKLPEFDEVIGTYGAGPNEETPDVINPYAGFAAMMEHLDNGVGDILELVEKSGIANNTLIIFASDNGTHKEGGHNPKYWNSSGGLRGHKRDMHEGGIRTPMLARWPGTIQPGTVTDHLSAFHDVLPTVCQLLEEDIPTQNTGLSFLPTLLGQTDKQEKHDWVYFEFRKPGAKEIHSQALRFDNWKTFKKNGKPIQLFDLSKDPFEKENLAQNKEHHDIVKKAKSYMAQATSPL